MAGMVKCRCGRYFSPGTAYEGAIEGLCWLCSPYSASTPVGGPRPSAGSKAHGEASEARSGQPTKKNTGNPPSFPLEGDEKALRLARKGDPDTSRAAGRALVRSGKQGADQAKVLDLIRENPFCTARELARCAGLAGNAGEVWAEAPSILKRLVELERASMAIRHAPRRCKVTGREAAIWEAATSE